MDFLLVEDDALLKSLSGRSKIELIATVKEVELLRDRVL